MKTTRRSFLHAALAAPLLSSCVTSKNEIARPENLLSIADILASVRDEANLPAVGAAVMKHGRLLALGAVGVRKVGDPTPVTSADKFHIGSCTKAMTATLAAMFVERGKLRWTDTLAEIFPERAAKMHPDYRLVTLEMLLAHRAGTPANADLGLLFPDMLRRLLQFEYQLPDYPLAPQRLAFMDAVLSTPPETKPGTTFTYSNAGYIFAGAILERITNHSWERIIHERLFVPLKMSTAGFGPPSGPDTADQPWAHILREGKYKPIYGDNPPALGPAGTVHCNLADYLRFADFHASLGARPRRLLSPESVARLHQPWPSPLNGERAPFDYAFGWGVFDRPWSRGPALSHHGSNTMNYFIVWVAPNIGLSLAIATNAAGGQMAETLDKIAAELVRRFA